MSGDEATESAPAARLGADDQPDDLVVPPAPEDQPVPGVVGEEPGVGEGDGQERGRGQLSP